MEHIKQITDLLPGAGWLVVGFLIKVLVDLWRERGSKEEVEKKDLAKDVKLLTIATTRLDVQVDALNKNLAKMESMRDDLNDYYKRLRKIEQIIEIEVP